MAVWRLQVNTGGTNVADYCLKNHVAAMGWSLRELTQAERSGIHTFLDYCNLARTQYKSFDSVCRMVEDVKEGDLLWMRSRNEGKYYIARVKANSTWVFREDAVQMDAANQFLPEADVPKKNDGAVQLDLFTDYAAEEEKQKAEDAALERERKIQAATLAIKKKYGKNAILKAMNLEEGATAKDRNAQIGGHKA